MLPDWLDWLSYLASSSKSHREISISCIFLQTPHQVDMKNVVKWWKDFVLYFTTLETYRALLQICMLLLEIFFPISLMLYGFMHHSISSEEVIRILLLTFPSFLFRKKIKDVFQGYNNNNMKIASWFFVLCFCVLYLVWW